MLFCIKMPIQRLGLKQQLIASAVDVLKSRKSPAGDVLLGLVEGQVSMKSKVK